MKDVPVNRLTKGTRVLLTNGDEGVLADSRAGLTRDVMLIGSEPGQGFRSVYAHEIKEASLDGIWTPVVLNERQTKQRAEVEAGGTS